MLASLVFVTTTLAVGEQKPAAWKEYVFSEDGFAITLPDKPTSHRESDLPETTVYSVSVGPNAKLSLHVPHQKMDCAATMSQLKGGALAGQSGIDSSSVKTVALGKNTGLEYEWKLSPDRQAYSRHYCVNGRLYSFSVGWPSGHSRPAAVVRILKSFRLLSP